MRSTVFSIIAALTLAGPASASPEALAEIRTLLAEGDKALQEGRFDDAFEPINTAVGLAYDHDFEGNPPEEFTPALYLARYYRHFRNWEQIETYAGSAAAGLDKDETRHMDERIEALMLFGEALAELDRDDEALSILEGAVAEADARGLKRVHERALYMLAETMSELGREGAGALRRRALDIHAAKGAVTDSEAAYLLDFQLQGLRNGGGNESAVYAAALELESFLDKADGVSDFDRSYYQGEIGLVLAELGEYDQALEHFQQRLAYLEAEEIFDTGYFIGGQRAAAILSRQGHFDDALAMLDDFIVKAQETGYPRRDVVGYFYRDIAYIRQARGEDDLAQIYFRKAYEETRAVVSASDRRAQALKKLIDREDAGMTSFSLKHEFGLGADFQFAWAADGSEVLGQFLRGNYAALGDAVAGETNDGPAYQVNRALYFALMGQYREAQLALQQARTLALGPKGRDLDADAPIFDMVEVMARVWSTRHLLETGDVYLERLQARAAELPKDMRGAYRVLHAFRLYLSNRQTESRQHLELWLAEMSAGDPDSMTPWDALAASLGHEMIFDLLKPEESGPLYERSLAQLPNYRQYALAHAISIFVRERARDTLVKSDDTPVVLGALLQTIRNSVPADHVLRVSTHYTFAEAMWARAKQDEALQAMDEAISAMRKSPYTNSDVLAQLVSHKGYWLTTVGNRQLGVSLARQAYASLKLQTDEPMRILTTAGYLVFSLREWGEPEQALQVTQTVLDNPRIQRDADQMDLANTHLTHGATLLMLDRYDEAQEHYVTALRLIPEGRPHSENMRSYILYEMAVLDYRQGRLAGSYDYIVRSNDAFFGFNAQMAQQLDSESAVASSELDLLRARAEAVIGWDYARQLAAESDQ